MTRLLPLMLTMLIFFAVLIAQIYFLESDKGAAYLVIGALLLLIGAFSIGAQVRCLRDRSRH